MDATVGMNCLACGTATVPFIASISDDRYGCPGSYAIRKCPSCGHMMTTPPLTEADLPGLYSQYYPRREIDYTALEAEAARIRSPLSSLRRWFDGTDNQGHYRARPGQRVLDVGCGSCLSLLEMRALGVEPYGIETDPNVDVIARRYGLNVHIGNIYDRPFSDKPFDLIVLNQVIEHVPDPLAVLQTVRTLLKSDGRAVLAFPNTGSWHRKVWGLRWINWHIPYHQNHFNKSSFAQLAEKAGYDVVSVRTITPNLWSILQLRSLSETKSAGKASATWSTHAPASSVPSVSRKLRSLAIRTVIGLVATGAGVVNRVMDSFGLGDSLLVELQPKKS